MLNFLKKNEEHGTLRLELRKKLRTCKNAELLKHLRTFDAQPICTGSYKEKRVQVCNVKKP